MQANDIAVPGPFVSAVLEYHYTHTMSGFDEDGLLTVGGSAGWDRDPIRAEVGTYYQRFKYEYYRNIRETTDVRSVFGQIRYRPVKWLSGRVRYEFEQFDRDIHTVTVTLTQTY